MVPSKDGEHSDIRSAHIHVTQETHWYRSPNRKIDRGH